jgi:hypothetical protein
MIGPALARATALLFVAALIPVPPALAARSKVESVPLVWRPSLDEADLGIPPIEATRFVGVKVRVEPFADERGVGAGTLADPEADAAPAIATPDDVAAFVTDRVIATLEEHGVPVVDERVLRKLGAELVVQPATIVVRLRGAVTELSVGEGATSLDAEARLRVEIVDAEQRGIWHGTSAGRAGRIARSYSLEDHQASLSDALLEALAQFLRSPDFVRSLTGQRAEGAGAPPAGPPSRN